MTGLVAAATLSVLETQLVACIGRFVECSNLTELEAVLACKRIAVGPADPQREVDGPRAGGCSRMPSRFQEQLRGFDHRHAYRNITAGSMERNPHCPHAAQSLGYNRQFGPNQQHQQVVKCRS